MTSPARDMLRRLPILAISGYSNSGKTTLIEQLVPLLKRQGLTVAVVKHDAHRIDVDRPGKDSDRFFKAGADVYLRGNQGLCRQHPTQLPAIEQELLDLARRYDLIVVEGFKHLPLSRIWLHADDAHLIPADIPDVLADLSRDTDRLAFCRRFIDDWLPRQWLGSSVTGLVLIGGNSSRMGYPKHLISSHQRSWLENSVALLNEVTDTVVLAGKGEVPTGCIDLPRLPDIPGVSGPLAGILTAMRWQPHTSWLVLACDLPLATGNTLRWLLADRKPGTWAILPQSHSGRYEPLLAYYDYRIIALLDDLAIRENYRLAHLAGHSKVATPMIPAHLQRDFTNINSQTELASIEGNESAPFT